MDAQVSGRCHSQKRRLPFEARRQVELFGAERDRLSPAQRLTKTRAVQLSTFPDWPATVMQPAAVQIGKIVVDVDFLRNAFSRRQSRSACVTNWQSFRDATAFVSACNDIAALNLEWMLLDSAGPEPPHALAAGRVTKNVAPWSLLLEAHNRPPWASTMERQIERPSPVPDDFVVTNGWNNRSFTLSEIPLPRSVTESCATP
jgi:hypothetical protein